MKQNKEIVQKKKDKQFSYPLQDKKMRIYEIMSPPLFPGCDQQIKYILTQKTIFSRSY